jgi:hypothetical protein
MIKALLPHVSVAIFRTKMATLVAFGWSCLKLNEFILRERRKIGMARLSLL